MMTHEGEYGGTNMNQTFASYATPLDAVNAWIDLLQKHYPGAVNAQDLPTFIHGLHQGGYFTAAEPEYLNIVKSIGDKIGGDVQAGLSSAGLAAQQTVQGAQQTLGAAKDAVGQKFNDISQFGDKQLSADEAYAACGPAAAVRFAERFGRNPTLREATDLAKQVGWSSSAGMAGIASEQALLKNMGVDTHIVAPDWLAIAKEAQTGNPVTISTSGKNGGHYYFADGYNPDTGAFHVGQSGLDLVGGSEWMTPQQMENLFGKAQGALFADNPNVPAKGASGAALGGTSGQQQNAAVTLGGPSVQPVQYVHGALQDAQGNTVADNGPTAIQSAQDVLGGAAGAVGGAASALGTAAQAVAKQVTAPVVLGAGQVSARDQVGQVANDLAQAAQGAIAPVLGQAQQTATNALGVAQAAGTAIAPNLGLDDAELQRRRAALNEPNAPTLGGVGGEASTGQPGEQTPQTVLGGVARAATGIGMPAQGTVQSPAEIAAVQKETTEPITQANPLNRVTLPGQTEPVPVIGGLSNMLIEQAFANPLVFIPGAPLGEALNGVGKQILEEVAPNAPALIARFGAGAVNGMLQNGIIAAGDKDATPQSVGAAMAQGAVGGALLEGVPGGALKLGQAVVNHLSDIAPILQRAADEAGPALRSRQPAQTDVNAALGGLPAAVERVRGTAEPVAPVANPYDLPRSAPQPDAAPLSTDAVLSHLEQLDQVHTQNDARIAELQNRLATGPSGRGDFSGTVVRPPWAAGWTNQGLEELARRNDLNPYEANWWERGNFVQGTGEMREDVGQSGIAGSPQYRGTKVTQQSPTEMRAELARLQSDQTQIDAAHAAIWEHAGQGGDVYAQPAPEALPFDRGGTDAGAAEAARGPAPANVEAPGVRGEAGAGVPGAPRAPEPASRAEPAPAELAAFRAPETTPTAAETAVTGARAAPGETVTATTPTARVTARVGAASDTSSPELNRLNAMYGDTQSTSPRTLGQTIQTVGDNLTRAFTDRQVDINRAQERYAKNLGRPLRGDEMAAELQRLASDPVAQVKVDEGLKPAIQSVGSDYPALRNYVTLRSNIEVADNLASPYRQR